MRILFVSPYYAPDLGPSAPMLTMLAEHLVQRGNTVTVLAAVPHFPTGQVPVQFRHSWRHWDEQNGVRICRLRVPSGDRANFRHRLLTFIVFQCLASWTGLHLQYDVALITNPAIETILPLVCLAWMRHKPAVFCVWDLYPEVGVQAGVFRHKSVIDMVRYLENTCLRMAASVQVLSQGFVGNLIPRVGGAHRIVVIPMWLDTELIRPFRRQNSFSHENQLDNMLVVMYAGNMGVSQGLETVLEAIQLLSDARDVSFVFVGDGTAKLALTKRAATLGLKNVQFIPFQSRARLPEVLASADVSLVVLKRGIGYGSLPSKAFSILSSGRPILASVDEGSDIWNLVYRAQAGWCVPPEDPVSLAKAILSLKEDPARREQMGRNGRAWIERYHSPRAAAVQFEKLFEAVLGKTRL